MMGNGNRANASIGRAVNLFKANFYGSVPIVMDNSTFGHPGKIGFCFPENLAVSPWQSLAAEKGYGDDATIVTAYATLAPLQVTLHGDRDPADFLTTVAHAMLAFGPNSTEVICVISPSRCCISTRQDGPGNGWLSSCTKTPTCRPGVAALEAVGKRRGPRAIDPRRCRR